MIKIGDHHYPNSREDYLKIFLDMRDNCSNELPDVDVNTLDWFNASRPIIGYHYKCRGNYIFGLSLRLEAVVLKKLVTDIGLIEKKQI